MTKKARGTDVTCDECYFRSAGLCALRLDAACPTFRPLTRTGALARPLQPRLVPLPPLPLAAQVATA